MSFLLRLRAVDDFVLQHVLSELGARAGDGGIAVENEEVVGVELEEEFERGFVAVVGVGVLSDVLEAEFIADDGAAGLR